MPDGKFAPAPAILYVDEAGKEQQGMEFGFLEQLVRKGHCVVAVDVRGVGSTKPAHPDMDPASQWTNLEDAQTAMAYWLWEINESLLGMRVLDVLRSVDYVLSRPDVDRPGVHLVAGVAIIYTTTNLGINMNSPEIATVTRNLTIKNTTLPNTVVIGQVSMPSLGLNWNISDDTVNHYGSVYRIASSFYPGQNGTVGLLGHHTRYSAPFNNTYQLAAGDQVIISDYLTQKKYIYNVTSNGDIKSDYKVNPVQFAAGTFGLTLITCYPPGYMEAAYQTHLNLVSVMPI